MARPNVGISSCLTGAAVRYDGRDKLQAELYAELGRVVEWVAVCPEVEVGMGVPREPLRLDGERLLGVVTGADWTERVTDFAAARVAALVSQGLDGYVCKARSPSCDPGTGLFAAALRRLTEVPIADEEQLRTAEARAEFVARVLEHARNR